MAHASSGWIIEANEANFVAEVIERSKQTPVVVDFTAGWCGPCQVLGPILEKLAVEHAGKWVLAKVDFDRNPYLAQQLQVSSIPAVFAFVNGQIASYFIGALPEEQVRAFLAQFIPSEEAQT
ncbi:MAG: thioredoxin domain-containing protein, partial [Gemmataceae bacterium]|nr:thioredoxin domain-containing protein [Gemmataceae bacterium]